MKQKFTLILTSLLLCGILTSAVLAAEEPPASATNDSVMKPAADTDIDDTGTAPDADNGTETDIHSGTDTDSITDTNESTDTEISSDAVTKDEENASTVAPGEMLTVPAPAITLTRFDEPDRTDAAAFAVDIPQEDLSQWFDDCVAGFTGYDADGNSYDLRSEAWSLDAVNPATPGVYCAFAVPHLGNEYTLAEGVSLPRQKCAVSIQTPGEPDINCCVSARGFLRFPWVLSAEQQEHLEGFSVWLRQDAGDWKQLSSGFSATSGDLQLSQRILENGNTYDLQATYPGGETGVLTFQYDGELSIIDYTGGDRDGGDVNGDDSSTGSQPAPAPPRTSTHSRGNSSHNSDDNTPIQDNSSPVSNEALADSASAPPFAPAESAPVYSNTSFSHQAENDSVTQDTDTPAVFLLQAGNTTVPESLSDSNSAQPQTSSESQEPAAILTESYSPTQTVISGLRLRDLCTDGENVVFGSGGLTVSIPSNLLLALNLTDSDTLCIRLTQPESNLILLAVEASGEPIKELPDTVLRLRYSPQSENVSIAVQNESGEKITDAVLDGGFLRFTADTAGTYTIFEASKAGEVRKGVSPLLPVSGGLILAAGGITFFRRRYHG